jgi:rhodanese-related sulfurtransferase
MTPPCLVVQWPVRALLFLLTALMAAPAWSAQPPLLSVSEAIALTERDPRAIYVDVRRPDQFERFHIPGSINVAAHFIKTKAYLRTMNLILVNQGDALGPLLRERSRLAEDGFEVSILAGGLAAWAQQNRKFYGIRPRPGILAETPAGTALAELADDTYELVVDISAEAEDAPACAPASLPVIESADREDLLALFDEQGLDESARVLLITSEGAGHYGDALRAESRPTLFFLAEGCAALARAQRNQHAMYQPAGERTQIIGACPSCPDETTTPEADE